MDEEYIFKLKKLLRKDLELFFDMVESIEKKYDPKILLYFHITYISMILSSFFYEKYKDFANYNEFINFSNNKFDEFKRFVSDFQNCL